MVKGTPNAIGVRGIMQDMGVQSRIRLLTDSAAVVGIAKRRGVGQVRHIEMNQLWLQEKTANNEVEVVKVKGTENPADLSTKYLKSEDVEKTPGVPWFLLS